MKTLNKKYTSIDLFAGVGGLSVGLKKAGFDVKASVEIDNNAVKGYKLNHPEAKVFDYDIRDIDTSEIKELLKGEPLHLLAGCPPCQGFSSIRRLNRSTPIEDERNSLIMEYIRLVKALKPYTIMMENVPGLVEYDLFKKAIKILSEELNYNIDFKVVNVKDYGVPQSRRRLVLVGSRLGEIKVAEPLYKKKTVKDVIGKLPKPKESKDELHKIFPKHTLEVKRRISLTPKDGGSWKDLPKKYILKCHKAENVGFNDVYGRLRWNDYSTTITGGCLNPSKGRFLHPEQNRNISAREAALLQSFPMNYKFPLDAPVSKIALMIGNALPPKFSYYQSKSIKEHLHQYLK